MMRIPALLATAAAFALPAIAQAQDANASTNDTMTDRTADPHANGASGTTFRGIRIEGNVGGDRFRSEGRHHDKLGYGGTVGFDGTFNNQIVVGAEGSYWRANNWNENCGRAGANTICHKAFEEWGVAGRIGYLVTPSLLVFGKGGYVNAEQRRRITGPTGAPLVYDHYKADGYQVGGGVEYDFNAFGRMPLYSNVQYVYSGYHGHSSRQRVMLGLGFRFR